MKIFLFFSLILVYTFSFSQTFEELENEISETTDKDSKSELLIELGIKYINQKNFEKATLDFNEALEIAEKTGNVDIKASSLFYLGRIYNRQNDYSNALIFLNKVISISDKISKKEIIVDTQNEIAIIYFYLSNYDKALEYFELSFNQSIDISDTISQAQALGNIAIIYGMKGKIDLAAEYHLKALAILEQQNNKKGVAYVCNNLGSLFSDFGNYDKAIEYHKKSLKMTTEIKDSVSIGNALNNIGVVFKSINQNDSSLFYFKKAYEMYELSGNTSGMATSLNNIGVMYKENGQYDKALENYNKSLKIKEQINDKTGLISSYISIGEIYSIKNNYKLSEYYLIKANALADSIQVIDYQISANEALYKFYEKTVDFEKAMEFYKNYTLFKDSLLSSNNSEQLNKLNIIYETDKKQKENDLLLVENTIQKQKVLKNRFIAIAVLIFFSAAILSVFMIYTKKKLLIQNRSIVLEQKLLRTQMNPHFIFNSLIAIQSYIFEKNNILAGKYISDFAKLMRLILENSREEYISVEKEIETLKFYLELQKLRFENQFDFFLNVDKNIEKENFLIPPMLAQPLIENAIEHGIKPLNYKGVIKIAFTLQKNHIFVEVEDNGIGIKELDSKEADIKKHKSYAIKILQERLNNYLSKDKSKLKIVSSEKGTTISFYSPFKIIT